MPKINNIVRIVGFESEGDLYSLLERELVSHINESDSRCYKLKNIQLLNRNHAVLYFEEDVNTIMVRFIYDRKVLILEDSPDSEFTYFSVQEIALLDELGTITVGNTAYGIDEIEYVMNVNGVRHADIYLN